MAVGNSVGDEIREQNRKMKDKPFKEKLAYFKEYYLVTTIAIILGAAFVINLIYTSVTATDNGLGVVMVNGYTYMDTYQYMDDFDIYAEIDTKEYSTSLEANFTIEVDNYDEYVMANVQKFSAMVAANQLDIVTGTEDVVLGYAESDYFYDLTDVLPAEKLQEYEDAGRLIYFDIPSDDKEAEVPVGIEITDTALIQESGAYYEQSAYLGIVGNSKNLENVYKFLEYIETAPVPMQED